MGYPLFMAALYNPNARIQGVKNGAERIVENQQHLRGMIEALVDSAKVGDATERILFKIARGHERERDTIDNVVELVRRNERNCLLVVLNEDKIKRTTYATEGAFLGGALGAVVGGTAAGAACVGGACPPLAPVCCLVVGGVAVGAVVGGAVGFAVGKRITKATVIIIGGDLHNITVEATIQRDFELVGYK